jgi:hypothetical protein
VAVFGFLQEFSSTALAKHFKTDFNQPRNKYFQDNWRNLVEETGDDKTTTCELVLRFYGRAVFFFYDEAIIFYGMTL